jgi:hypothetical protein
MESYDMSDSGFLATVKCETEVQNGGRVEVTVPLSQGTKVLVFVVEDADRLPDDLVAASASTLGFWDNPLDDEDWNSA